jgi:cytochrome P450
MLVVFETGAVTAILKSSDFVAVDFGAWHRTLGRMGIDCTPAVEALHHIASANEGERHAEVRRETARVIVARSGPAKEAARRKTAELFASLCRPGAQVDLVREIIEPVCDTTFEALLGALCPATPENSVSGSQIFDLYLSLNRRKEIVARTSEMLEAFAAAENELRTSPSYATAIKMLGYDSIVGSLARSILHLLKQAPDRRLCEIDYPRSFPETGVPYVERFAARDCGFGGASIKQGDRVRLYLDPGSVNGADKGACYFGRGRHSCLGEDLSQSLWRLFADEMARLELRCTVESETRRKPDWVFFYYSSLVVRFHA